MELPPDVVRWVAKHFPEDAREQAIGVLIAAKDHQGQPATPRLLRCLALSSHGDLALLRQQARQLAVDFRDVIVSGEYENRNGELVRVRDFSQPMS